MEISDRLAAALHDLVLATDAARRAPADHQAARRAIEQAAVVAQVARDEGFGDLPDDGR